MKFNQFAGPAALFLLLGTGASVYGQHEEQGKPEKPEGKAEPQHAPPQQHAPQAQKTKPQDQQTKQRAEQPEQKPQQQPHVQSKAPAQHPQTAQHPPAVQQAKPSPLKANYAPPQRTRQQATTWQQQSGWRQDGAWQGRTSWQQDSSSNWQSDHRTWAQRGGYGGYYIPQASFGLHFGVGNWFRIQSQPVIVGGYPRFQYGGYSFLMVDPWPSDWAADWYAADDVYVGFDNGYYLYNRQYPGEALAITVVL
jgi:hypothetical protein